MTVHQTSPHRLLVQLKRSLLVGLFALVLAGMNQAAADTIFITGEVGANFNVPGPGLISGVPTLSYATVGPVTTVGAIRRAVTVRLLEALPPGVTIIVRFSPDPGKGISTGDVTLSTVPQVLVDQIGADVEQATRSLSYTISASQGFSSVNLAIEYAVIDR